MKANTINSFFLLSSLLFLTGFAMKLKNILESTSGSTLKDSIKGLIQVKENIPKYYADVVLNQPDNYSDYENYEFQFGDENNYKHNSNLTEAYLGSGSFSTVIEVFDIRTGEQLVLKLLDLDALTEELSIDWIKKEVLAMETLKGAPYVIQIKDVIKIE